MTYKGICLSLIMVSGVLMGCSKDASTSAPKEPAEIVTSAPVKEAVDKSQAHMKLSDEDIQSYKLNGDQLFITLNEAASRHLFKITSTEEFRRLKATWRGHVVAHASLSSPDGPGELISRKPSDELIADLDEYTGGRK